MSSTWLVVLFSPVAARPTQRVERRAAEAAALICDVLVVEQPRLPAGSRGGAGHYGMTAVQTLDTARIKINGKYVAVLGVDPSAFPQVRGQADRAI